MCWLPSVRLYSLTSFFIQHRVPSVHLSHFHLKTILLIMILTTTFLFLLFEQEKEPHPPSLFLCSLVLLRQPVSLHGKGFSMMSMPTTKSWFPPHTSASDTLAPFYLPSLNIQVCKLGPLSLPSTLALRMLSFSLMALFLTGVLTALNLNPQLWPMPWADVCEHSGCSTTSPKLLMLLRLYLETMLPVGCFQVFPFQQGVIPVFHSFGHPTLSLHLQSVTRVCCSPRPWLLSASSSSPA